jgi:hypothetical protein
MAMLTSLCQLLPTSLRQDILPLRVPTKTVAGVKSSSLPWLLANKLLSFGLTERFPSPKELFWRFPLFPRGSQARQSAAAVFSEGKDSKDFGN